MRGSGLTPPRTKKNLGGFVVPGGGGVVSLGVFGAKRGQE